MGYLKLLPLRRRFKNNHSSKIQQSTDRLVVDNNPGVSDSFLGIDNSFAATECRANQKRVGRIRRFSGIKSKKRDSAGSVSSGITVPWHRSHRVALCCATSDRWQEKRGHLDCIHTTRGPPPVEMHLRPASHSAPKVPPTWLAKSHSAESGTTSWR